MEKSHRPLTKADVISELKALIVRNKDELINGEVPLCLTPEVLLILNHGFEHLSDTRFGTKPVYNDLEYLQSTLSSTRHLRLSHGGCSTIQACVNLSPFKQISHLEIKRIPPHWITGLYRLCDQLILLRMSRSLNYLDDLFSCSSSIPSEDAVCFTWSRLKKLYLSNNFIKHLDKSLELLPSLEVLDLSQNYLRDTEDHLICLSELVHINLAYNSLTEIPRFSTIPYTRLKTLVLCSNHLEHVNGVEVLTCLETIDLSSNIICDHGALLPLKGLSSLTSLYLQKNPLANNPRHRVLAAALLTSRVASSPLVLDGQSLNEFEIRTAAGIRATIRPPPEGHVNVSPAATADVSADQESISSTRAVRSIRTTDINSILDIPQPSDDQIDSMSSANIRDDSDDVAVVSYNCSPTRKQQPQITKSKMETLREEFGDSWLTNFNGFAGKSEDRQAEPECSTEGASERLEPPSSLYSSVDEDSVTEASEEYNSQPASQSEVKSKYDSPMADTDGDDYSSVYSAEDVAQNGKEQYEHDPFIVKSPRNDAEEFLVVVTQNHIIEKNIQGVITEMLDLSALLLTQPIELNGHNIVKCKFDYFRKDRRERQYVMEDLNDSMRLVDLLQPMVLKSQARRASANTMECLKCGKRYEVPLKQKNSLAGLNCPHCDSDMVVELTVSKSNITSTPYGTPSSNYSDSSKNVQSTQSMVSSDDSLYATLSSMDTELNETDKLGRMEESDLDIKSSLSSKISSSANDSNNSDDEESSLNGVAVSGLDTIQSSHVGTPDDTVSYISLVSESEGSVTNEDIYEPVRYLKDNLTGFKFDPNDLSYIDHRLKLYLTLTYFSDDEQPMCILRSKCVTYNKVEEYSALLLVTNYKLYIFRVFYSSNKRAELGGVLDLLEKELLSSIHHIEIGLDHNNIRFEFENRGYCFLLRDSSVGRALHAKFSELLSTASFTEESKLQSINKINQEYHQQLSIVLLSDVDDFDTSNISYCSGFKRLSDDYDIDLLKGCQPMSFVIDNANLYLVKELYYLPFTRNRLNARQKYFILESKIPISDIAHLQVCLSKHEIDVEGFEEQASEFIEKLVFVSAAAVNLFISLIQTPWSHLYGIDLQVNYTNGRT